MGIGVSCYDVPQNWARLYVVSVSYEAQFSPRHSANNTQFDHTDLTRMHTCIPRTGMQGENSERHELHMLSHSIRIA